MFATYRAVLHGQILEWYNGKPQNLPTDRPLDVHVTILEEETKEASQGQRMADILGKIAALQGGASVADPIVWERETRQDRSLPGRDEHVD